jgi:hypothetical protein
MVLKLTFFLSLLTSSAFAQKEAPTPEKVVQTIGAELRSAKTIGEWINKSSAKSKLFRRTHFSKYANEKMPQLIVSGASLLVFEKNQKKKPSVLRVSKKNGQLNFTWNGFDITKPKNMQLEKWFRQKFPSYKNTAQWNLTQFLLASAHAQSTTVSQLSQNMYIDPNTTSYWTALMASMTAAEWENVNLYARYGGDEGSVLINAGAYMRDQYKLACSPDGKAMFDFPFDGDPSRPFRIGTSYDAEKKLARVSILRTQQDPILPAKMGEIGRLAYNVMGADGSVPGANIGKAYLYDGHTQTNSEHDSLRDGNFLHGLYTVVNTTETTVLAEPSTAALNTMYDVTQGMVALADFARGCCANADCRGRAQLPTSETGVSQ